MVGHLSVMVDDVSGSGNVDIQIILKVGKLSILVDGAGQEVD